MRLSFNVCCMSLRSLQRRYTLLIKQTFFSGKCLNIRVVPRNRAVYAVSSRHAVCAPLSLGTLQRWTRCPRRPLPGSRNRRKQGSRPLLSSLPVSEVHLELLSPEGSVWHNHCNLHLTSKQRWILPHTHDNFPTGGDLGSVGSHAFLKYKKTSF